MLRDCEGQKDPQSPKPRKIQGNEKQRKSDLGDRPESNKKVT